MIRPSRSSWLILSLILCVAVWACPIVFETGYGGSVIAKISPQVLNPIRLAVRRLPGLEGPRDVKTGNPDCGYYGKALTQTGVRVAISECYYGSAKDLSSEEEYWVSVSVGTRREGRLPEVRAEVHELLQQISRVIQKFLPAEKITIREEPPFVF